MSPAGDKLRFPSPPGHIPKGADIVAEEMRSRILREGLEPGDELPPESELIVAYGFSRGTIREGLRLLEAEGWIRIRRGRNGGVEVARPDSFRVGRSLAMLFTVDQVPLGDFIAFRKLVEPEAAFLAARKASEEGKRSLLLSAEAAFKDPGHASDFHGELGRLVPSGTLRILLSALHHVLTVHIPQESISAEDLESVLEVHLLIARDIANNAAARARTRMVSHLNAFERVLKEHGRLEQPIISRRDWPGVSSGILSY